MPYLVKGQNKYNLDTSSKADLDMIAQEYNSQTTYLDGDLFIFQGELYKVDSTADYIRGVDHINADSFLADNGYLDDGMIKTNGGTYNRNTARTIGYTPVEPNKTYVFDYKRTGSMQSFAAIEISNSNKTVLSRIDAMASSGTKTQFTTPANSAYVRMGCGYESLQSPRAELYELYTSMPKCIKVDLGTIVGTKQDTLVVGTNLDSAPVQNSTNPITSGGVYSVIGNINTVLEEVL